jgi:hypothetical protein
MSHQSEPFSEIVEIAKHNGDFRKNYGKFLGAYTTKERAKITAGQSRPWSSWGGLSH